MKIERMGWWSRKPAKSVLARLAAADPSPFPKNPQRILVVREGRFGDIIVTIPLLKALRRLMGSEVRIDILVRRPFVGFLEGCDLIDRAFAKGGGLVTSLRTLNRMRARNYDVVIDLVSSPSLSFALWILRAAPGAHRIGGAKAELRGMYHQHIELPPRPDIHFMERLRRIIEQGIGNLLADDNIPWIEWPADVTERVDKHLMSIAKQIPDGSAGAMVLVNLSAGIARRTWPDESYDELMRRLIRRYDGQVRTWLISAAPSEYERAERLAQTLGNPKVVICPKESDFRVVAALVGRMNLVVTPDTSILHAASAQGIPLVVFTVAENVISWAPWKIPAKVVAAPSGMPVSAVTVDDVEAAFDEMAAQLESH